MFEKSMELTDLLNGNTYEILESLTGYVDNVNDVEAALNLYELLKTSKGLPKELSYVAALPRMKTLIDEGWRPKEVTLDELLALPSDSLGFAYGSHMKHAGLTLNKLNDVSEITSPLEYVSHRMRETHDIFHVLTGFDTSQLGEVGVLGFGMSQFRSPISIMLIPAFLYKALLNDGPYEVLLDSAVKGIRIGQKGVECIPGFKFEDDWEKPLSAWRHDLGIIPVSELDC